MELFLRLNKESYQSLERLEKETQSIVVKDSLSISEEIFLESPSSGSRLFTKSKK